MEAAEWPVAMQVVALLLLRALVEQAKLDVESDLSYLSSLPWPTDLEKLRGRFGQFGIMCRDVTMSVVEMLDPDKAAESRAAAARIIESADRSQI